VAEAELRTLTHLEVKCAEIIATLEAHRTYRVYVKVGTRWRTEERFSVPVTRELTEAVDTWGKIIEKKLKLSERRSKLLALDRAPMPESSSDTSPFMDVLERIWEAKKRAAAQARAIETTATAQTDLPRLLSDNGTGP
jgi:hypothetical protein